MQIINKKFSYFAYNDPIKSFDKFVKKKIELKCVKRVKFSYGIHTPINIDFYGNLKIITNIRKKKDIK